MLIICSKLCAPPSEVVLFRDITLFSKTFLKKRVLIECEKLEKDFYYKWLKQKGAFDYIDDIVEPYSENGITIRTEKANILVDRINYANFSRIINGISIYKI